jgi:hypothetical protein
MPAAAASSRDGCEREHVDCHRNMIAVITPLPSAPSSSLLHTRPPCGFKSHLAEQTVTRQPSRADKSIYTHQQLHHATSPRNTQHMRGCGEWELTRPRTRRRQRAGKPCAGQPAETCRAGRRQEWRMCNRELNRNESICAGDDVMCAAAEPQACRVSTQVTHSSETQTKAIQAECRSERH